MLKKEQHERMKTRINVGKIGHVDCGATTLAQTDSIDWMFFGMFFDGNIDRQTQIQPQTMELEPSKTPSSSAGKK